jgi:hypothetical protein
VWGTATRSRKNLTNQAKRLPRSTRRGARGGSARETTRTRRRSESLERKPESAAAPAMVVVAAAPRDWADFGGGVVRRPTVREVREPIRSPVVDLEFYSRFVASLDRKI